MNFTPTNLFADLPLHLPDELITTLLEAVDVRIERIVSHGHSSPDGFGTTRTSANGSSS
jgi:cupin 2 domain-containing protein